MGFLDRLRQNVLPLFMQDTRVTRYKVLEASVGGIRAPGGPVEIVGSQWAPHFTLPGIVPSMYAVLTFVAQPKEAGTSFRVRVSTGRDFLLEHTFSDTEKQVFHVVTQPNALQEAPQAGFNEILFSVGTTPDGRAGTVTFFDAVIMYTSNKLTVEVPPQIKQR
jgi:hypothetical protein